MVEGIHRVAVSGALPAGAIPKAKERRESDSGKQFERELERKSETPELAEKNEPEQHPPKPSLHVAPLSEGEPGNLLDLTA